MRNRTAARLGLAAVALAFIVANGFNAMHKGGDAQVFFDGGRRLLHRLPLYDNSGPATGFIGPPFQALFFAPFAVIQQLSDPAARLCWYGVNLACLIAGLFLWQSAWTTALARSGMTSLHRSRSAWLALLAIALPLQTNFEHQNMNPLLLAALGGMAWALVNERWTFGGALLGFAAAIKVFPALVVVYLLARRLWRPAAVAIATAFALSSLPLVVYGPRGFLDSVIAWWRVGSGGWPVRGANQSLVAAIDRVLGATATDGVHTLAGSGATVAILFVMAGAMIAAAVLVGAASRQRHSAQLPCQLATTVTLAVLLSPIAWDHYWVLLYPAFLLVHDSGALRLLGRPGTVAFWLAAVLTSGISRGTLGPDGWMAARNASVSTLAALVLYGALLALWWRLGAVRSDEGAEPAAAGTETSPFQPRLATTQD